MKNKGLLEYEQLHKITPAFLEDYQHLCNKIYSGWHLRIDFDEFFGYCTEKLVDRLPSFDSTRSNIGNYVYNLILNEARRIHSSETHLVNANIDEILLYQEYRDESLVKDIWMFAVYSYKRGVYVDQDQLLADYQLGRETPACTAFCWLRAYGRLS